MTTDIVTPTNTEKTTTATGCEVKVGKTREARNALAEQHYELAERLARRRYSTVCKTVQYGDLLSAAYSGLLDAAERFELEKVKADNTSPFKSYATQRIQGEMNDYLRSCNWGTRNNPRIPKSLDRESSQDGQYDDYRVQSLSRVLVSDDRPVTDVLNAEELFNKIIRCLPYRERTVFTLRYMHDLTMKEVADVIGLSESRVSQILSSNTEHLKDVWFDLQEELWDEASKN